jgi:hypothetical protein
VKSVPDWFDFVPVSVRFGLLGSEIFPKKFFNLNKPEQT